MRDDLDDDYGTDQREDDPGGPRGARGDGEEHRERHEHGEREPNRQCRWISLQPGGNRGTPGGEQRAGCHGEDRGRQQRRAGPESQKHVAPAGHGEQERMDVPPAVVRRPRRYRDQQP